MNILFRLLDNTKINILNFLVSIGNRLLITNLTIFIWGEHVLGEIGTLLAFVAGSTFIASVFELQLSKGQIVSKKIVLIGILSNVLLVLSAAYIISNIEIRSIVLLFLIQIIINVNLVFSGYFFSINKFVNYRKNCIKSEFIELFTFVSMIMAFKNPIGALIIALLAKNGSLLVLSSLEYIAVRTDYAKYSKPGIVEKKTNKSHLMDVIGAQLMASVFPVVIAQEFGPEMLGLFLFYRQFFMLGGVLQSAVFRGLWRDHINGSVNTDLLRVFLLFVSLVPAVVALPVLYVFEITHIKLFTACGLTFLILNWNRLTVLIDGHIFNKKTLNAEIVFVNLFTTFGMINIFSDSFILSLCCAAIGSLLVKICYESFKKYG